MNECGGIHALGPLSRRPPTLWVGARRCNGRAGRFRPKAWASNVAPGLLWRYRLRARDVLAARWRTVSAFAWQRIDHQEFRVCAPCMKRLDNDPARAAYFTVTRDGGSIWIICKECGTKERLTI